MRSAYEVKLLNRFTRPLAFMGLFAFTVLPLFAQDNKQDNKEVAEAAVVVEDVEEVAPAGSDLPPASLTLGVFGTDDEAIGQGDATVPLWYDPDVGMLLFDARTSFSDRKEEEMNLGVVYRRLLKDNKGILGLNAYYDSRWTESDTQWDQFGMGFELLSVNLLDLFFDLRFNYYAPEGDEEMIDVREETSVSRSSSSRTTSTVGPLSPPTPSPAGLVQVQPTTITTRRTTTTTTTTLRFEQFESALEGWDIELGVMLPGISDYAETRIFGGYQDFDNPYGDDFEGFKGRLEVRAARSLIFDLEVFEDERLNGTDYFVGGRLVVPLDLAKLAAGRNPFSSNRGHFRLLDNPARDVQERMVEQVIRDPKIQTVNEVRQKKSVAVRKSTSTSEETTYAFFPVMDPCVYTLGLDSASPANGSLEPYCDKMQATLDAARPNAFVLTHGGTYGENVVITKEGLNLSSQAKPVISPIGN